MHTEWLAVQGWCMYTVEGAHQPKICYLSISIPPPNTCYLSISTPPQANWEQEENENIFWVSRTSQLALVVKNKPANAGDVRDSGSTPESGRSPGGGQENPLQYSCLENPMDRGAWWDTVHMTAQSWTQQKWLSTHTCMLGLLLSSWIKIGGMHAEVFRKFPSNIIWKPTVWLSLILGKIFCCINQIVNPSLAWPWKQRWVITASTLGPFLRNHIWSERGGRGMAGSCQFYGNTLEDSCFGLEWEEWTDRGREVLPGRNYVNHNKWHLRHSAGWKAGLCCWNHLPQIGTWTHMLGLEPSQNSAWDSNPHGQDSSLAKTLLGTWTHMTGTQSQPKPPKSLPTEITNLVSGPNEAQVLDVSSQKEFSERYSER